MPDSFFKLFGMNVVLKLYFFQCLKEERVARPRLRRDKQAGMCGKSMEM
jgi:hypothetical protein